MRDELDKQLCEQYPKIFAQRNLPMSETCMCWGFAHGDGWFNIIAALCGAIQWHIDQREKDIERCNQWQAEREAALAGDWTAFNKKHEKALNDPKWAEWIEREKRDLTQPTVPTWMVAKEPIPQVEAVQVKEKFGTLRFYYEGGDEYIRGLVTMAEAMSAYTCEVCGAPGEARGGGWIQTLCDEHAAEREAKRNER